MCSIDTGEGRSTWKREEDTKLSTTYHLLHSYHPELGNDEGGDWVGAWTGTANHILEAVRWWVNHRCHQLLANPSIPG